MSKLEELIQGLEIMFVKGGDIQLCIDNKVIVGMVSRQMNMSDLDLKILSRINWVMNPDTKFWEFDLN